MSSAAPGWGEWSIDPGPIIAIVLTGAAYIACYRRAHRRTGRRYAAHLLAFTSGLGLIAVALLSPLDSIGDRWLLSAHTLQHVLLADVAPALLVLGVRPPLLAHGLPPELLRALSPRARIGRVLRSQWFAPVALGFWVATQWAWSIPVVFDTAAAHPLLHTIEHLCLLGSGVLLWTVVVDPLPGQGRRAVWGRLGYLGASRAAAAVVCLPLTWLDHTLYSRYADAPRAYGISALTDQHIGGAGMCLIEFLVFGVAFIIVFLDLLGREEQGTRVTERASQPDLPKPARNPLNVS
ncbi:MAG: cytochrome c oxidase assembly protein [Solirubrobacterales bacterium]|nr:cytochrome c oxidase assembly protein [Solirubrobacterales bacterium]